MDVINVFVFSLNVFLVLQRQTKDLEGNRVNYILNLRTLDCLGSEKEFTK